MTAQQFLFSASNLAGSVQIPLAPEHLTPHSLPLPGMTPMDSARSSFSKSSDYQEMLAAVINASGGAGLTDKQVLAQIPASWRDLCGEWAHACVYNHTAKKHAIDIIYTSHDGGGFHFEYRATGGAA